MAHDLGHGPYSHLFDYDFLPAKAQKRGLCTDLLMHENRSVKMFEQCVEQYGMDVDKAEVNCVGRLIHGDKKK